MDGALADFDRAIAINPQQAAFYSNRGRAWLLKGEFARALSDIDHTLAPKLAEAWGFRGAVWYVMQDFAQAIADLNQALQLNPDLADVYGSRGLAWLMQNKLAEAEADFARCRAMGGTLKPAMEQLLGATRQGLAAEKLIKN